MESTRLRSIKRTLVRWLNFLLSPFKEVVREIELRKENDGATKEMDSIIRMCKGSKLSYDKSYDLLTQFCDERAIKAHNIEKLFRTRWNVVK